MTPYSLYPRKAVRSVAPAVEPVSLADVKTYLRIDHTDDDSFLNDLIEAARDAAETYLRRSLITQTWVLTYDENIPFHVDLPHGPVQSITSVVAEAEDTSTVSVNSAAYKLLANDVLRVEGYVSSHKIHVTYVAGYGDAASDVPAPIRQGIIHHVGMIVERREDLADLPGGILGLYAPYRKMGV